MIKHSYLLHDNLLTILNAIPFNKAQTVKTIGNIDYVN